MDLLDQAGREPSNCPNDWDEPADTAEIDLERATWDADYRSQVLDLLRRKRRARPAVMPLQPLAVFGNHSEQRHLPPHRTCPCLKRNASRNAQATREPR